MSVPALPPLGKTECDPEFVSPPTPNRYFLQNKKRPLTNFIDAEITGLGYFHYNVKNESDDGLGCPGTWLFEEAWIHFIQNNVTIGGIRGDWTFGVNLATINALAANNQMTLEEAARDPSLWAFQRASSKGYTKVILLDCDGSPVNYTSLTSFTPSKEVEQAMFGTQLEVVYDLRTMALRGSKPSEMLRTIVAHHSPEVVAPVVFYQYFKEAFCFSEGEASPLYGWRPDGTGELKDANIDYLMTRRIHKNRMVWGSAPRASS